MQSSEDGRRKVFVSYSHNDSDWLKRLQVHLKPLERRGLVELWDDTKIRPGDEWRKEIGNALDAAKVAVLLISADFLASDFIAEDELPPLLTAAEKDGVVILPLILKASLFEETEGLSKFQAVNPSSKPLVNLTPGEQEEYLVKLSKAVLRAIEEAPTTPAKLVGTERRQRLNLPFPRNKFFTGRGDILEGLHTSFNNGESVQALNGIGGIGKTQSALEYAYRYRQDYEVVLWASAHARETLIADLAAIAGVLNLPEKNAHDQSETVGAVKRWLENNGGWLLILDNADDLAMAREFIPSKETGHILLTTRAQNTRPIAVRQAVEKMEPREGALFLLQRLEKMKNGEPLESVPEELRKAAEALSKAVDGLPLALDQAAAFIEEKPSTLEEYQILYQSECKELLKRRGKLAEDHPSVTITFSLAFTKVAEANPAAADLLRVCAFLEADSIPEEIFSKGAKELGEALGSVAESPLRLSDAIEEAGRYSLLRRQPETHTLSLHRLVQAVLKDEMGESDKRLWAERIVRAVNAVFPDVEYSNWSSCKRLIAHAQSNALLIDEYGFEFLEAARLMNQAGKYLNERAQYGEAEPLFQRALAIREKVCGTEHPDVAKSLRNLALLYRNRGKYGEAEPLFQRALAIFEKVLGAEHPQVANNLNDFAVLYRNQGKYREAEPLFKRALAIREKLFGAEHPDIAQSLHNLAMLYDNQGKYSEAEPLYQRALAIREKVLNPDHPWVANSLHNIAVLYRNQSKYREAEPLFERALAIREKALGAEHPKVADSLNNLAWLYQQQGQYTEAEPLLQRALASREKALGAEHPDVAASLHSLALLYYNRGKYAEAELFYQRALAIREKALGAEHPDIAKNLNDLALLYAKQRRLEAVEPLLQRTIAIREKALSSDHPDFAESLNDLAGLYSNQGRYAEAEPLYKRALAIIEQSLGPEHPDFATSLMNLAMDYNNQSRYAEAEPRLQRALAIREQVFGPEHPYIGTALYCLACLRDNQDRYAEAEPLYLRALDIREKTLGLEHPFVARSLNGLAKLYHKQERYVEAEPLYLRALDINEKVLGAAHPDTIAVLENYGSLLRALGREGEADGLGARGRT